MHIEEPKGWRMPDQQAEDAVRSAVDSLSAQGMHPNCQTVPDAALKLILAAGASKADAPERIQAAIVEMVRMGTLTAPSKQWETWSLTKAPPSGN